MFVDYHDIVYFVITVNKIRKQENKQVFLHNIIIVIILCSQYTSSNETSKFREYIQYNTAKCIANNINCTLSVKSKFYNTSTLVFYDTSDIYIIFFCTLNRYLYQQLNCTFCCC